MVSLTPAAVICERSEGVPGSGPPARNKLGTTEKPQADMSGSSIYAILVCGSDRGGGRWCPDPLRHLRHGREVGADMPHDGRARTGVSAPGAWEVGTAGTGSPPTEPEPVTSDRALTFAGAALAAVYAPTAGNEELQLIETVGATPEYRLPDRLSVSGGSAATRWPARRGVWASRASGKAQIL